MSVQCLHQMHRDIVFNYPPGIEQLGHTPRTLVPALYVKDKLITVQGHPEFDGDIVADIAKSRFDMGLFDKELYEDAMSKYSSNQLPINSCACADVYVPYRSSPRTTSR